MARSDNAILRQDLQVFREREGQLLRRNRELEEKLLMKKRSKAKVKEPASAKQKAELDINIDFVGSGKALIQEKKVEEKQAEEPPPKVEVPIETESEKPKEKELVKEKPEAKVSSRSSSRGGDKKSVEVREEDTSKATIDTDEWKVTVTSSHQLDVSSESPKTIVVTRAPEEKKTETPPPLKAKTPPLKKKKPVTAIRRPVRDARSDPIPKPPQFPCARPTRDQRPVPSRVRYHERPAIADLLYGGEEEGNEDLDNHPQFLTPPNGMLQVPGGAASGYGDGLQCQVLYNH